MKSTWSGSLSFGLVNIPVKLYGASKDRALKFRLLEKKSMCPISYQKVCKLNDKEVPLENITRGYEVEKGEYVLLSEEDFEKASPRKTKTIEIENFSNEKAIDPLYFVRPFYIEPESKAAKAYALLRDALKKTKKVAVVKFVLKNREHVGIIKPDGNTLILNQLRYQDEVRSPKDLEIPDEETYSSKELDIAVSLVEKMEQKFDIKKYEDEYTEKLEKLIEAKKKGKRILVSKDDRAPVKTDMKELMTMLRRSLEQEKSRR